MKKLNIDCYRSVHFKAATFIGILLLLAGNISRADEEKQIYRWELWTGSIADFSKDLNSKTFSGGFFGGRSSIAPSLGYFVSDHIEVLLAPSFTFHGSGNYLGRFTAGVCGNYFGKTVGESYFGKITLGFDDIFDNHTSDDVHFTLKTFIWSLSVGKRFEITPSFSFSPELNFTTVHDSYSPISSLTIVPLQFSLFL